MSIELKNLNKNYDNFKAVKNLDFKIETGSIIGLLGPNGCGKTTTIGMILGLIKPTSGEILVRGKNVEIEKNRIEVLEKMNFISPYVELPKKLTVRENLIVYGKMYEVKNLKNKINNLIDELHLGEFEKKKNWRIVFRSKK